MNRPLSNTTLTLAAAILLLSATGSAGTLSFTSFGGFGASSVSSSAPQVNLVWDTLTVNGTEYDNGTYTETYSNATGLLSIVGNTGAGSNIPISLQIQEGKNLATVFNGSSVNLYSGATSVTFGAPLLTLLGVSGTPTIANVSGAGFSVIADSSLAVGKQVSSAIAGLNVSSPPTSAPEPATFAMFALAGLVGIGVRARRKVGQSLRQ